VALSVFVRLKLRILANGMRGSTVRVLTFVLGVLATVYFGGMGFLLFAAPGFLDAAAAAAAVAALGGAMLVLGWLLLPLLFFGVDESLDPARFALLPIPRRRLVAGLFTAALLGLPAIAVLLASSGLVLSAALIGGAGAAVVAAVGALTGLALCVLASRAVTAAFASALRSRKVRDLAAVMLTAVAALVGPLQLLLLSRLERTDWGIVLRVAEVFGWTPFGAPWTLGSEAASGRWWAVPVKLLLVAATLAVLAWWWSRSLESAMLGARGSAKASSVVRGTVREPVDLLVRLLPRTRFGALVAREVKYWWREARRRASLLTMGIIGVFLPVLLTFGDGTTPFGVAFAGLFVGLLAAVNLANQFGFEGTAYAANIVAAVPGRVELHSRVAGLSLYLAPIFLVVAVVVGVLGSPAWIAPLLGTAIAGYGVGTVLASVASVLGAYAMPDTSNPFAISSGGGVAKSMLAFAVLLGGGLLTAPYLIIGLLTGTAWPWLALPFGLLYGGGLYLVGIRLVGGVLDRRAPELLMAVQHRS
jgi:ABC-2 type transport system permease protein